MNRHTSIVLALFLVSSFPASGEDFALTHARQLRTAADIYTLNSAIRSFKQDNRRYPPGEGEICVIETNVSPLYVKFMPRYDAWGTTFQYAATNDGQHFRIVSAGADMKFEPAVFPFQTATSPIFAPNPETDIVFQDGQFIQAPPEVLVSWTSCR